MGIPPTPTPSVVPLVLPDALRAEFLEGLRAASSNLREAARVARSAGTGVVVEKALRDAWSHLAHAERAAGLAGAVSIASSVQRFVVVDDSPDTRFFVTRLLRGFAPSATIQDARDAEEALALLTDAGEGEGVMVISDHDMGPGANGEQLLSAVAARHPKSHRILFTGHPIERLDPSRIDAHALLSKDEKDALRRYFGAP